MITQMGFIQESESPAARYRRARLFVQSACEKSVTASCVQVSDRGN
jgi:hypothetical protein